MPIEAITNGVHLPSWIDATWLQPLADEYPDGDWTKNQDRSAARDGIEDIPDHVFWEGHQDLKGHMLAEIDGRPRASWHDKKLPAQNVIAFGAPPDPKALTLGLTRRLAAYERHDLMLHDMERFRGLVTDPLRPVRVILAG